MLFSFIFIICVFSIISAQIHLTRLNLADVCNCDITNSDLIDLFNKSIVSIDQNTFTGLDNVKKIDIHYNNITTVHPDTFKELI